MDLFNDLLAQPINVLPHDGEVNYYGPIVSEAESEHFLAALQSEIDWQPDEAIIMGKTIKTKRHVAWYGDAPYLYTYSKSTKKAKPWTEILLKLKAIAEQSSGELYNSCLLNLYHDGSEGMAWHSDAEKDLKPQGAIGSMSFGAPRKFAFKHKRSQETVSLLLEAGSLLVMKSVTQANWLHRLPPTKTISEPRVNLTFRTIVNQEQLY